MAIYHQRRKKFMEHISDCNADEVISNEQSTDLNLEDCDKDNISEDNVVGCYDSPYEGSNSHAVGVIDYSEMLSSAHLSEDNKKIFTNEAEEKGSGLCRIVGNAFSKGRSSYELPSLIESQAILRCANLLQHIPTNMHREFIQVLNDVRTIKFKKTRLPEHIQDIPRLLNCNKNSVFSKVLYPFIEELNGHSYISPISIIDYVLALGISLSWSTTDPTTKHDDDMWNTEVAKNIRKKFIFSTI
jgi:hypothetical protein